MTACSLRQDQPQCSPPFYHADVAGVHVLRNIEDGISIKKSLCKGVHYAVVIGGGLIDLEVAEQLSLRGISVTVVEAAEKLIGNFSDQYGEMLVETLTKNSVTLEIHKKVTSISSENWQTTGVLLDSGKSLRADLVVMSIGVKPATALAQRAGLEVAQNGALIVDEFLQTSDASIYACGDCVISEHILTCEKVYIPMGTTANKQGKACGDNITGIKTPFKGVLGSSVTKVFGLYLAGHWAEYKSGIGTWLLCCRNINQKIR